MNEPQKLRSYHLFLTFITFLGWMISAMDASLFFFIGPHLMEQFDFDLKIFGFIVGGGFLLAVIFSIFVGPLMDFWGRKLVFQWILVLVTMGTFLSGLAWSFSSLVIFRLIATGGAFAEYAVGATILMESVPKKHRGWLMGIMAAGWPAGTALAGVITIYSIPSLGWRSAFFIATIPAFIVIVIRLFVEEPEQFMKERKLRINSTNYHMKATLNELINSYIDKFKFAYNMLLTGKNLYNSILVWIYINSAVFAYSILIWFAPYWMSDAFGLNLTQTTYVTVLGSLISVLGYICCGWLGGQLGIRRASLIFISIGSLLIIWLNYASSDFSSFLKGFLLWNFFGAGIWGIIPRMFTERFPTRVRGTAASVNSASCWLGWAIVSSSSPFVLENFGYGIVIYASVIVFSPLALITTWIMTKD
ncbi:MFS transporter [Pseudogracilibacillus sp. SO10305]|uniref:MFS transporter n=1 Tax=Pseudogracilibacillus sp. SO10305 TaxID=3098292 RepID=UPI00300DCE15